MNHRLRRIEAMSLSGRAEGPLRRLGGWPPAGFSAPSSSSERTLAVRGSAFILSRMAPVVSCCRSAEVAGAVGAQRRLGSARSESDEVELKGVDRSVARSLEDLEAERVAVDV